MKSILFPIALILAVVGMISCGDSNESDVRRDARESLDVEDRAIQPTAITPNNPGASNPAATAANTSGVDHYTCPNNCEGSGGSSQVACPVCGTQYVHNTAFHSQPITPSTSPLTTTTTTSSSPTITPPDAQNTSGVYHYTCPSGCEGGAGGAGSCATCGTALTHNTAFHN